MIARTFHPIWRHFVVLCFTVAATALVAQSIPTARPRARPASELTGWADWENAAEMWQRVKVPPAPVLSPSEAMETFQLAPGYRIELVASEPQIANPIFFEFDPDGRIWVIEYRGYMRDLRGLGEGDPICRIVVLEDDDEDGRAEKTTVFLDGLVMPRSLAFVKGGVLVAEPPDLWFCEDLDGDLRSDRKRLVGSFGVAGNPQHTANGLRYGLDNWLHSADWPKKHRWTDDHLVEEETLHRGQFGVSFDDFGRMITCYENSPAHADFIPDEYILRNPNLRNMLRRNRREAFGIAANIASDAKEVFPIRPTPQITLGALELRDDGRLRTYTIVSGTCFYNGHQFPDDAYGNLFVPEAGGHLVGRLSLNGESVLHATRFYPSEQELLASTDERFRPVNARVGPDGALYIADMYHGIIEHVIFMAPYLEKQIKDRNLEAGNDMGRIWRIVYKDKPIDYRRPRLSSASSPQLIRELGHRNGWRRLTAQRLLVEKEEQAVVSRLRNVVVQESGDIELSSNSSLYVSSLGRLHALWTLEGMKALDWKTAFGAMMDVDPYVRAASIRLCESLLTPEIAPAFTDRLIELGDDVHELVRLQSLLSLGILKTEAAEGAMIDLAARNPSALFRTALLTGVENRELEFLSHLMSHSSVEVETPNQKELLNLLAQIVIDQAAIDRIDNLLTLTEDRMIQQPWQGNALLKGILSTAPRDLSRHKSIVVTRKPELLQRLVDSQNIETRTKGRMLEQLLRWPGKATNPIPKPGLAPLSVEQQRLAKLGQIHYATTCAPCHQPHGKGLPNVAPPLDGSPWVTGNPERLVPIILHGIYGYLDINGQQWNHHMPGLAELLDDETLAGVLTYIRRSWENNASPIEPKLVSTIRARNAKREVPWTVSELEGRSAEESELPKIIEPNQLGSLHLAARDAVTHGQELAYRPTLDILAPWRREQDVAEWRVQIPEQGDYEASITLAADDASAGDRFRLETGKDSLQGEVPSTGGYNQFQEISFGTITIESGVNRLILRPDGALRRELADVRSLKLTPVGKQTK